MILFRTIYFRIREEFLGLGILSLRKKEKTPGNTLFILRCFIEKNFRPEAPHRSCLLPWSVYSHLSPHVQHLFTFDPSPSNRHRLPIFISLQHTCTRTPESLFISRLRTWPAGLAYSFAFVRFRKNGWEKQRNGNGRFESGGERSTFD